MVMNLALLAERDLEEHGEYERLWFEERSYTNRELLETSKRFARALADLGVAADDKVVVLLANCPEVLVSYAAIWRAGAVAIPVLHVLEAHELAFILKDSAAKAVVTSHDLTAKVQEAIGLAGSPKVTVIGVTEGKGEVSAPVLKYEDLITGKPLDSIVAREKDDLAVVLYTSGTTGQPKGVMQSHNNLIANAQNGWNTAKTRDPSESILLVLPLAHTFGLSVVVGGYLFGGRAVLMRRFHPVEALQLIERFKVAVMSGVPTMFMYMLMLPEQVKFDTSSIRIWIVGAAPMPMEQLQKYEQRYGGQMYVGYGLTEASPTVAVEREGEPRKPGSTGRPVEGVRVKIVDEQGNELPTGQVGEVCAAGENITLGYLGRPDATAETFRNGWLHTGDMGYLDEDNYLFIVERKKDLIIRGGLNIYPKDVEEVIYRHPAVRECAVVGVPDLMMGEQVCACIVLKDGAQLTAEEVIEHCQQNLAKYKTPRFVEFLKDLPKTTIGKIQKKELRKLAAAKYENSEQELIANAQ
jgi:long-chain acyl-CoA synthetase